MRLGQPETAAERAAEQREMEARSAARAKRNARIVAEIRMALEAGDSMDAACLRAARTYKLGKGGTQYVRALAEKAHDAR